MKRDNWLLLFGLACLIAAAVILSVMLSLRVAGASCSIGDVDCNSITDMGDVIKTERMILGLQPKHALADVTRDGVIDMADVLGIELIILRQP